jgi:hypothetical protein
MQLRDQQRAMGVRPGTVARDTAIAPGRRTTGARAIAAGIAGMALLIVTIVISLRGGSALRNGDRPSAVGSVSRPSAEEVRPTVLQTATGWVDGLAAGLILPSDITSRLAVQDPDTAKVVVAAWSDLSSLARPARLQGAVSWIDGLAAGLILPSDVTSRLAVQDPDTAKVVVAAWSDLSSRGAR